MASESGSRLSDRLGICAVTHGFLEKITATNVSLNFVWMIPDFFSREEKYNYRVQSPQFEFLGIHAATQVIEKYLNRAEDEESQGKEALSNLKGTFKLGEDLKGLLLNGTNFDVTIKISDREFGAHRAILGARSSVFQSMFSHDTTERNTGVVQIEDCDPDAFQDFLLFLYSGEVEKLCSENVLSLYALADKYDVLEMKTKCVKFMTGNFSVESFCDVVALALRHNEIELLKAATEFFIKNTQKIIFTTKWQCFLEQYPIECNELYVKAIQFCDQE